MKKSKVLKLNVKICGIEFKGLNSTCNSDNTKTIAQISLMIKNIKKMTKTATNFKMI